MKYKGEKCSACGNIFTDNDDVVVCPDCGSPHHRQCYAASGRCANHERHGEKFRWKSEIPEKKSEKSAESSTLVTCTECGASIQINESTCPFCGAECKHEKPADNMSVKDKTFLMFYGVRPDSKMGELTVEEMMSFVKQNSFYYYHLFRRFSDSLGKISFNFMCFVFPPMYFATRRMWGWAAVTTLLSVLLTVPLMLVYMADITLTDDTMRLLSNSAASFIAQNREIFLTAVNICNVVDFVMRMVLCLFGNWMYYIFTVKSIKRIRQEKSKSPLTAGDLRTQGGLLIRNALVIVVVTFVFTAAAMFFMKEIMDIII